MAGPGNFEDVGLRASISNVGGFEDAANRVNGGFAKLAQAASKTAAQTNASTTAIGSGMVRASDSANRGFNTTAKGMAQLAENASRSENALFRLLRPLTQIGFAVFGVQAMVAAITTLGNAVLGASIQWEQFGVTFEALLGSATLGTQKLEELAEFARRTPFTLPQVVTAAKQLLAYGFSAESLIPMLRKLGDAAAALGDDALPRIARALGQMQARTKVSSQEMLQLTEVGIPAWKLLADAMQIPVAQLQKMVEKGIVPADAAIKVLLAGMEKRFKDLGDKQAKSFGGILSNLQDWVFQAQVLFTKPIFDQLKGQLESLLKTLETPEVEKALKRWGEAAGAALQLIIRAFSLASRVIGAAMNAIATTIQTVSGLVQPPLSALNRALGVDMGTALQISIPLIALWSAGIAVRAVGALVAWSSSMVVATARTAVWLAMLGLGPIVSFTGAVLGATAALIAYSARGAFGAIMATGKLLIALVTQGIPAFAGLALTILTRTIPAMISFVVVGMANIVRNMPKMLAALAAAALAFGQVAIQATIAATRIAAAWVVTAVPAVLGAAGAIIGALAAVALPLLAVGAAAALMAVAWANNWGDIQGITGRVLGWVADRITEFISWLKTVPIIGGAVGVVEGWVQDAVDVFKTQVPQLTAAAGDAVGGIVDQFKNGFPIIQDLLKDFFALPELEKDWDKLSRAWEDSFTFTSDASLALENLGFDLDQIGKAASSAGDAGRAALRAMERQVQDTRDSVKQLETALKDAQDAMKAFADPQLPGMQAADDEIFNLEQALKRAQLEELKMGKAAKDAVKDVGSSFDLLGAQQEELAQGIPVTYQKFVHEAEQQKRRAEKDAADAARALEKSSDEETETERLRRLIDIKRLEKELTFEPMLRALREHFETLTGANKEITFQQAWDGLEGAAKEAEALSLQLDQQKAVLDAQEIVLEAAKRAYEDQQEAAAALEATTEEITALENLRLAALQSQTGEIEKQTAESEKQLAFQRELAASRASARKIGVDPNQWSLGGGFAGGGTVGRGGVARVGERGPETVLLPAGAQVVPNGPAPASSTSISESSTFNIAGASSPIDVADAVRRMLAFERIRRGRR